MTGGAEWSVEFPYHVERWDLEELHCLEAVALCGRVAVAHAAFKGAIEDQPDSVWLLRQRIRVLKRYMPGKGIED